MTEPLNILITSYLEPELVERIRAAFPDVAVINRPDLLGTPRYVADHTAKVERTPEQQAEWRSLLTKADILFDFDYSNIESLPELGPNVKWVQASSAGIGQFVKRNRYAERTSWIMTTASGVHAGPLAEFALMAMLMFAKNYVYLFDEKEKKHWARYCAVELHDSTVMIVGLGSIGREVALKSKAFGMHVIGTRRDLSKPVDGVDLLFPASRLREYLPQADYLVVATPHTAETEDMIGAREIAQMKRGAVVINLARGVVIDEAAMTEALANGHLGGAALDVFRVEPLPDTSPLWDMPNVIVSPHSASTTDTENHKLVDLFCENLRRFRAGEPLKNVLNPERLY